jgi:hypothetical protein
LMPDQRAPPISHSIKSRVEFHVVAENNEGNKKPTVNENNSCTSSSTGRAIDS